MFFWIFGSFYLLERKGRVKLVSENVVIKRIDRNTLKHHIREHFGLGNLKESLENVDNGSLSYLFYFITICIHDLKTLASWPSLLRIERI